MRPIKGKGQGRNTLTFDVKCNNDAHIALLSSEDIASPMIEVFIGGWSNQKSAIRLNASRPDKAEESTPDVVCNEEFRRFWISFKNNVIKVGKEGDPYPFLCWENTEDPFKVTHFAFSTGWGSSGTWIFDDGQLFPCPLFLYSLINYLSIPCNVEQKNNLRPLRRRRRKKRIPKRSANVSL